MYKVTRQNTRTQTTEIRALAKIKLEPIKIAPHRQNLEH